MAKGIPIKPEIKAEILDQIKNHGLSSYEAEKRYGVCRSTISNWMRSEVIGAERNLILENNRLRKEIDNCHRVIGRMVAEINRPKG